MKWVQMLRFLRRVFFLIAISSVACRKSKGEGASISTGLSSVDSLKQAYVQNHPFNTMKYGLFVHLVAGLSVDSNGVVNINTDSLTMNFDVKKIADDLQQFGVEYVVLTAWHAGMKLLYPSAKMDSWITGHSTKRDLVGDIIDQLNSRGIKVLLYTHPYLGYHFNDQEKEATGWGAGVNAQGDDAPNWLTFNYAKWNNFINDIYGDFLNRYGNYIQGVFIDEGDRKAQMNKVVDFSRLRTTIKSSYPGLIIIQNNHGSLYSSDIGAKEYYGWEEFAQPDGTKWPAWKSPVASIISREWWASLPVNSNALRYNTNDLYRYTVLQASCNTDGGGIAWAAGPYTNGGWEFGVKQQLVELGKKVQKVARSIKNTRPSTSFLVVAGTTFNSLRWGVSTKSADDKYEFIHVLKKPSAKSLVLPLPIDKKVFAHARLLLTGEELALIQNENGVTITLGSNQDWDDLDTVVELEVKK